MTTHRNFFELLQVAVGNRPAMSRSLTEEEWWSLLTTCNNQTLDGIGFVGCQKLGAEHCPPRGLLMQWASQAIAIVEDNRKLTRRCGKVASILQDDGYNVCIQKGQSNLAYYPEELRGYRTPGDIDLWALPKNAGVNGRKSMIAYVTEQHRQAGLSTDIEVQYHHVDWQYKGVTIELHYRVSWLNDPMANWRLQQWSKRHLQWGKREYEGFPIPTAAFNVVYQLVHINRHLFNEGIGLRQLLDYYFVLKAYHDEPEEESRDTILRTLSGFNLRRFAGAVMYVLQTVFAMPDEYLLCGPRVEEGRFLLDEIMMAGNFGKYDARNKIKADEGYVTRFVRRQRRFMRFLKYYPNEVFWGPYFSVTQRCYRWLHGYK